MHKLFYETKMTWPKVLMFSLAAAVLTAVLNLIPALQDTSFQDIAISVECWILFAMFIILNCNSWLEASLKTFVFFLVSQPLIYLIEAFFLPMGFGVFQYYIYWGKITLLTFPGAAIAYQVKRDNWLSVAVLSVANCLLSYVGAMYIWSTAAKFPHHLLSAIFCMTLAGFLIWLTLSGSKKRLVAILVALLAFGAALYAQKPIRHSTIELGAGAWEYVIDDEDVADIRIEGDEAIVDARSEGTTLVKFTGSDGTTREYYIDVYGGNLLISEME